MRSIIRSLNIEFQRAKAVLGRGEGLAQLLTRRGTTYYLYRTNPAKALKARNEADFMPEIPDFSLKVVTTSDQIGQLASDGLEVSPGDKEILNAGGIAFLIYVGQKIAHSGWVAMSASAKKRVDPLPYRVDFANNEACIGALWTRPGYKRRGLMVYAGLKQLEFLRDRGVATVRMCIASDNIASQGGAVAEGYERYARSLYRRILWWRFWRETPL